ncbi:MAG: 5'-methylthioadenosine/S-adenosylhomocysteine nucleosidase [Bdellovibrio sp.]
MQNKDSKSIKQIKKLLVIAAMDIEAKSILSRLTDPSEFTVHSVLGMKAVRSVIDNHEIYLTQSGIGLVNAALTTSYAIDAVKPDAILLLGVAGAVIKELEIGDVIVADKIIQHDSKYSGENGDELMAPGELHLSLAPADRVLPPIKTDMDYATWLTKRLHGVDSRVHRGTILSGSEFVGTAARKKEISKIDERAFAVEMEAAGVGQIAAKLKIPLMVVKTVADRLNPDGSISSDYIRFSKSAADTAATVLDLMIAEWRTT